ncbi:MAG TPA: hypothetical protein VHO27_12470 [Angustibacter sp.]|nr:hypothetical protein [Angustibacter sp.]
MRRHDLDVTSLVFGLIFLGVAATWALVQTELVTLPDLSLLGPAVLIVAGVVGLAATLAKNQRSQRDEGAADVR